MYEFVEKQVLWGALKEIAGEDLLGNSLAHIFPPLFLNNYLYALAN